MAAVFSAGGAWGKGGLLPEMDYNKFTKRELAGILDIIQEAASSSSPEDIKAILKKIADLVSCDYCICGAGSAEDLAFKNPPTIINGNYPEEWVLFYGLNRLYNSDPLVIHNLKNPGPQIWSETFSMYRDRLEPLLLFSRDFGLEDGVCAGVNNPATDTASIISFSGKPGSFGKREMEMLGILAPHMHQALSRIFRMRRGNRQRLSSREEEIVKWIKAGKTNWEISMILNISERTVKFHMHNIEKKLDAVNKAHAIAILMEREAG